MKFYEKNEMLDLSTDPLSNLMAEIEFLEMTEQENSEDITYERVLLRDNLSIRRIDIRQ